MGIFGDGPTPMATCPYDGEPLMATFERAGFEFHCLRCGRWIEWLAPNRGNAEQLQARHDELRARFDAGERGPLADLVEPVHDLAADTIDGCEACAAAHHGGES